MAGQQDVRWSPCLKQCEEDLDNTDNCRIILLLVENIRQQLLHRLLPEEDRHKVTCHIGRAEFNFNS